MTKDSASPRTVSATRQAWFFCNPFLEERTFSHVVYVHFARQIATLGRFVLRFANEGDGDSEGESDGLDLSDWVSDVEAACEFVHARYGLAARALFGLRLGAMIACLTAVRTACSRLLWEPVASDRAYIDDCLKINLTTQLATYKRVVEGHPQLLKRLRGKTFNIAGHEIGGCLTLLLTVRSFLRRLVRIGTEPCIDVNRKVEECKNALLHAREGCKMTPAAAAFADDGQRQSLKGLQQAFSRRIGGNVSNMLFPFSYQHAEFVAIGK